MIAFSITTNKTQKTIEYIKYFSHGQLDFGCFMSIESKQNCVFGQVLILNHTLHTQFVMTELFRRIQFGFCSKKNRYII